MSDWALALTLLAVVFGLMAWDRYEWKRMARKAREEERER